MLSLIAFFSAVCLIFPALTRHTEKKSVQGFAVGCWIFGLLWTFGSAVATTDYAVNRDAKVRAYSNGVQLDPKVVSCVYFHFLWFHSLSRMERELTCVLVSPDFSALQKATGLSPKYWIHGYSNVSLFLPLIIAHTCTLTCAFYFIFAVLIYSEIRGHRTLAIDTIRHHIFSSHHHRMATGSFLSLRCI